jgi:hypothetical protein
MVPGNDPVRDIIDQMHQNDLKLYAIVDLFELIGTNFQNPGFITNDGENKDSIQNTFNTLNSDEKAKQINEIILSDNLFPQLKTYLKSYFRSFSEKHDIDGLTIDLTDFVHYKDLPDNPLKENPERESQASSSKDLELLSQRLKDLLEDIVVECMLIKPYLVNSIIIPEEDMHLYIPQYVEEGVVDFVISKFQLDTVDAAHEFQALIKGIFNGVKVAESVFPWFSFTSGNDNSLNIAELSKCIKENKGHGYLLSATRLPKDTDRPLDIPYQYSEVTALPENLKKVTPFQVIGLNINTLFPENASGQIVQLFQGDKIKVADKEGCIGFITFDPDTINIETAGQSLMLLTDRWAIPYKYTLLPDGGIDRNKPWVEFRKMPPKYTHDPDFHLLYKSEYPAEVRINNDPVKVYKTGIFFKKISLNEGPNRIRATILTQDSQTAFYEREFIYEPIDRTRKPFPLWIDEKSIEPVIDLVLLPDENVQVSFQGSFGQKAYVMVEPGGQQYKCSRKDYSDYSQYRLQIQLIIHSMNSNFKIQLE